MFALRADESPRITNNWVYHLSLGVTLFLKGWIEGLDESMI